MDTYRRSGIVTGILFLAADAAGFLTFIAKPILGAPDYLTRISANEPTVLAGALLVFIMGWADAGIGISMYPILRRHNEGSPWALPDSGSSTGSSTASALFSSSCWRP